MLLCGIAEEKATANATESMTVIATAAVLPTESMTVTATAAVLPTESMTVTAQVWELFFNLKSTYSY